jgi:hypothetical protein
VLVCCLLARPKVAGRRTGWDGADRAEDRCCTVYGRGDLLCNETVECACRVGTMARNLGPRYLPKPHAADCTTASKSLMRLAF